MCALLEVIKKSFQFVQDYRDRKPSYAALLTRNEASVANENETLEQFLESLWKAIDQTCVPALMLNYESTESLAVFENFFEILHLSVSPLSTYRDVFARKLASGSFVRLSLEIKEKFCRSSESKELGDAIARFLTELCLTLGDPSDFIQLEEVFKTSSIVSIHSATTCLNLLTQSSARQGTTTEIVDVSLFNTQCACIELLYEAFSHGDTIVPIESLATCLHKYLVLHSDLSILPRVSLKHLLHLWIASYSRLRTLPLPANVMERMEVAQEILEQRLVKVTADEFESIHIHDVIFVSWIFSRESLAQVFGRQALVCFLEREKIQNSSTNEELQQLLTSNEQCFRAFVSLVDCNEEAIASRVGTILEALMTGNSEPSSNKITASYLRSAATHITSTFHKLFLSHKSIPLQDHSITAMLNVLTAVQMQTNLAFDVKLLYHVINLLTFKNGHRRFTVCAINYLNVSLTWDTNRENQRVAAVLLSNKAFCSYVQDILNTVGQRRNSAEDVNLLAGMLVLISSLAISLTLPHQGVQDAFKVDKKCMINLANEGQNILGLANLVFWDVFFSTTRESENPILVLSNGTEGTEHSLEKLSEEDLLVLLVYLQNSLVHDSETVRQCAVKCFASFLSYVPNASCFACNPWNRIVLESQLCVLNVNVLRPSLVLFCLLILQYAPNKHYLTDVLQNAVESILDKTPSIPCSEQNLSWHCFRFLAQVLSDKDKVVSQNQKDALLTWLTMFKKSLNSNEERSSLNESFSTEADQSTKKEVRFYKIDAVIFSSGLLKPAVMVDPDLMETVFRLLKSKSNEDDETTN